MTRRRSAVALAAVVALGVAGAIAISDTGRTTKAVPASIDATGKTDVTAELNGFFRSVPNGSTVTFPAKARYRAEATVLIDAKRNVEVDGNDALIYAHGNGTDARPNGNLWFQPPNWPLNREHLMIYRSTDVLVKNLRIRGPNNPGGKDTYNAAFEGQAGVGIFSCTRCELRDSKISHVFGDGVELDHGNRDVVVKGVEVTANGRQGMTILDSRHTVLTQNKLSNISRSVFDIEPEIGGVVDLEISENEVGSGTGGIFVAAQGGGGTDDLKILRNRLRIPLIVKDSDSHDAKRRKGLTINGNTTTYGFDNYPIGMIALERIDGVTIKNNRAFAPERDAVHCQDCTDVVIEGNAWQR